MSLNTTTLSSACLIGDRQIVVASATGAAAGTYARVDDEVMVIQKSYVSGTSIPVLRGQDGTYAVAHPATSNVTFFLGSDEVVIAPQTSPQFPIAGRGRPMLSYTVAGAITLPAPGADMVALINGTNALAMTVAAPTKDMDGCVLTVIGNGKAAHTVSFPVGVGIGAGGSGVDVATFASGGQQSLQVMAANGVWVPLPSFMGGSSLSSVTVTYA